MLEPAELSSHVYFFKLLACYCTKFLRRRRDSNSRVLAHAYFPSMWNGPLSDSSVFSIFQELENICKDFIRLLLNYLNVRPRRESNPHHRIRNPAFYPLDYKGNSYPCKLCLQGPACGGYRI